MPDDFPADVERFILEHITSVEQIEVLLLLRAHSDKDWNAQAVSRAIYTQPDAAAMRLADLHGRGFLTAQKEPGEYRYHPQSDEQKRLVDRLAELYKERRVAVISLIYSKPQDPVQVFADVFRLRKEK
jgi:hypothetical protein